jgi:hypothetical protein
MSYALNTLCGVLTFFAAQVPVLQDKDFSKEIQQAALLATVQVTNSAEGVDGSGVLLGSEGAFIYILTANHVVAKAKQVDVSIYSAGSYPRVDKAYREADVVARDARADLAVIRLTTRDTLPAPLLLCPAGRAPAAKTFAVLSIGCQDRGVPLQLLDEVKAVRVISKPKEAGKTKCWETARAPIAGRSGGPLVDSRGLLIGIASGMSDAKGYYIHLDEIRDFLKRQGLAFLADAVKEPERKLDKACQTRSAVSARSADRVNLYGACSDERCWISATILVREGNHGTTSEFAEKTRAGAGW